uniref:Uncharacterized protein n=1 Tax=Oryza nivara TaxID=4536 RepID=A0A0E0GSW4_ORYNI
MAGGEGRIGGARRRRRTAKARAWRGERWRRRSVEHPASSSSSLPASRAPPCVASPFPSIRWISGRATAPATSPRSREKDAQEDRSLCTAVLKIELAFLISGCRLIPSIPRSRPEDRSEPTPSIAAGEFLGLPSSFKLRRRTHDLK